MGCNDVDSNGCYNPGTDDLVTTAVTLLDSNYRYGFNVIPVYVVANNVYRDRDFLDAPPPLAPTPARSFFGLASGLCLLVSAAFARMRIRMHGQHRGIAAFDARPGG